MLIKDKKVFITGGCSGMGRAVANLAIAGGSKVTIFDFAPQEKLDQVQKELGENCYMFHGDVTDEESVKAGVAYAVEKMGGLTSAVNCAGDGIFQNFLDMTIHDFDWTLKLCLYGTFFCVREEGKYMKELGGGSIVNFSSISSDHVEPGSAAYSSAKAAINALTKSAALELGQYNIRVNGVRPGLIATEKMAAAMAQPGYTESVIEGIPIYRAGKPEDVADYVAYLLDDQSCYITGTLNRIDGGMHLV